MLIKNKYTPQSLKDLQGEWKEIAILFQALCTDDRRLFPDGTIRERVKPNSLPITTFLNTVYTIVEQINNEFGAMYVSDLYAQLDKEQPHTNTPPKDTDTEYDYCCNRMYERTIIFAAVYYIVAVQNPNLTDVLTTIYKQTDYLDARPYLNHFTQAFRRRGEKSNSEHNDSFLEIVPPHIIPDIQALNNGYRHLPPRKRLAKFRQILVAINAMNPIDVSPELESLRMVVDYSITNLQRIYNIWDEDEYIPENEKISITDLIKECKSASTQQQETLIPFVEQVISAKQPKSDNNLFHQMLHSPAEEKPTKEDLDATFTYAYQKTGNYRRLIDFIVEERKEASDPDWARYALAIYRADILKGKPKTFKKWLSQFCDIFGRMVKYQDPNKLDRTKSAHSIQSYLFIG